MERKRNLYHYCLCIGTRIYGFWKRADRDFFVEKHGKDLGAYKVNWTTVRSMKGSGYRFVTEKQAEKEGLSVVFYGTDFVVLRGYQR